MRLCWGGLPPGLSPCPLYELGWLKEAPKGRERATESADTGVAVGWRAPPQVTQVTTYYVVIVKEQTNKTVVVLVVRPYRVSVASVRCQSCTAALRSTK
jgi:hypothetical protein